MRLNLQFITYNNRLNVWCAWRIRTYLFLSFGSVAMLDRYSCMLVFVVLPALSPLAKIQEIKRKKKRIRTMTQIEEAKKTRMDQWKPSCGELVVIIEIGVICVPIARIRIANSTKTNAVFIYLLFIECNRHVRCSGVWALLMRRTLAVKFVLLMTQTHKNDKLFVFCSFLTLSA